MADQTNDQSGQQRNYVKQVRFAHLVATGREKGCMEAVCVLLAWGVGEGTDCQMVQQPQGRGQNDVHPQVS